MQERIQSISHQRKHVLLVDCSNCLAGDVEKIVRAVPDYVTAQPLGSVLLLVDFTGASFDQEALRAMKECAAFDKQYIKKATWVGSESLPQSFEQELKAFSQREFPTFKTRTEALNWLVGACVRGSTTSTKPTTQGRLRSPDDVLRLLVVRQQLIDQQRPFFTEPVTNQRVLSIVAVAHHR